MRSCPPSRSPQNVEYLSFSAKSSITTSSRLPLLLRATTEHKSSSKRSASNERILILTVSVTLLSMRLRRSLRRRICRQECRVHTELTAINFTRQDITASGSASNKFARSLGERKHSASANWLSYLSSTCYRCVSCPGVRTPCRLPASSPHLSAIYGGHRMKSPQYSTLSSLDRSAQSLWL